MSDAPTTPPTPTPTQTPTLTGQDIGQAQYATRAVLDRLLGETGTPFVDWVTLNLTATAGPLTEDQLVDRMSFGLKIDAAPAQAAIDQLVGEQHLVRTDDDPPRLALTPTGQALFQRIRHGIAGITERLYGGLPAEDLATAHRVLAILTERANAELAR